MQTFYTTLLKEIYKTEIAEQTEQRLINLVESYRGKILQPSDVKLSERDSLLITYGDQVQEKGKQHLQTLAEFCETYLKSAIGGVHILPFFPWSSDDGFSVKDYRAVDPALGNWNHIERLSESFRLMFDGVINHMSAQGEWFQKFLQNQEPYNDYFVTVEGNPDLSNVVRPRALPLLTEFKTAVGKRKV